MIFRKVTIAQRKPYPRPSLRGNERNRRLASMQNARFYCTLLLIGIGALLVSLKHTHVSTIEKSSFADIPTRSLEAAHKNGKKPKRSGNTRPHSTKKSTKEIKISKDSMHTNATVPTSLFDSCGNSALWLKGPRHGNSDDDKYLSPNIVQSMILNLENSLVKKNVALPVLEQTICHKNSRLMNMSQPSELQNDEKAVRLWAVKLIYLAIHYHQHRHAIHEAKRRHGSKKSHCSRAMKDHKVGIFDYECPNAKYIVMPLGGNGLGANVRGGMVVALLMGLMSDRVVLFVNGARKGHRSIKKPWSLASCSRQDYQCFFWAPTPCSLTEDDLLMAYTLTHGEYLRITKKQSQLKSIQHHKVWVFNSAFLPVTGLPRRAGETLYKHAQTLISAVSQEENPPYYELLQRAAESIKETDKPREGYNYAAAGTKVQHALSMYAMRPNPRYAHELDEILADIIPRSFHPENSIGLPIRASDKCTYESECLSFDQHMQVSSDLWQRHLNATGLSVDPTVVFTTEATSMAKEQRAFVSEHGEQRFPFKFDFVTNTQDITPDSGFMKDIVSRTEGVADANKIDADKIMLSAMSSLKAQLLPRISIGNCCSNFHVLLNDLLSEGCGAASDNKFLCLQEYDDPALRVCCGWHSDCKQQKADFLKSRATKAIGSH